MTTPYDRSARWYDRIYGDKAYREEADALRSLVAGERPGASTLLEVGCGTGGHLVFLREHFACTGVDLSASMLAVARDKLPGIALHEGDMRDFDLGARFDVVASLFSAIGYVRSTEELVAAIACMARHLQPAPRGIAVAEADAKRAGLPSVEENRPWAHPTAEFPRKMGGPPASAGGSR